MLTRGENPRNSKAKEFPLVREESKEKKGKDRTGGEFKGLEVRQKWKQPPDYPSGRGKVQKDFRGGSMQQNKKGKILKDNSFFRRPPVFCQGNRWTNLRDQGGRNRAAGNSVLQKGQGGKR